MKVHLSHVQRIQSPYFLTSRTWYMLLTSAVSPRKHKIVLQDTPVHTRRGSCSQCGSGLLPRSAQDWQSCNKTWSDHVQSKTTMYNRKTPLSPSNLHSKWSFSSSGTPENLEAAITVDGVEPKHKHARHKSGYPFMLLPLFTKNL